MCVCLEIRVNDLVFAFLNGPPHPATMQQKIIPPSSGLLLHIILGVNHMEPDEPRGRRVNPSV